MANDDATTIKVKARVAVLGLAKGEVADLPDGKLVREMLRVGYVVKVEDEPPADDAAPTADTAPTGDTPPDKAAPAETAPARPRRGRNNPEES